MKKLKLLIFFSFFVVLITGCNEVSEKISIEFVTNNQSIVENKIIEKNTSTELPNITMEGFNFIGWFDENDEIYNNSSIFAKNTTLYAKWDIMKINIKFINNNNEVLETFNINYGTKLTFPSNPSREGYNFIGWFDSNDTEYFDNDEFKTNKNLYAKWEPKKYEITFLDYNDEVLDKTLVEYNNDIINYPLPTRDGYEFVEWDKDLSNITSSFIVKAVYDEVTTGLEFSLIGNEYIVSNYTGDDNFIKIPRKYRGLPVVSIGEKAFYNKWNITGIYIPNSIIKINSQAFYDCYNLTNIIIPQSVQEIGEEAFLGCLGITSIELSSRIIGNSAFYNCTGLLNITINDEVESIGSWAFQGCSKVKEIFIPATVSSIGKNAFSWCRSLTKIYTPIENFDNLNFILTNAGNIYTNFVVVGID